MGKVEVLVAAIVDGEQTWMKCSGWVSDEGDVQMCFHATGASICLPLDYGVLPAGDIYSAVRQYLLDFTTKYGVVLVPDRSKGVAAYVPIDQGSMWLRVPFKLVGCLPEAIANSCIYDGPFASPLSAGLGHISYGGFNHGS